MFFKIVFLLASLFTHSSFAQQNIEDTTEYSSSYDDSITFIKMSYLPTVDNVNGVYAKAINERIEEAIKANHKWQFVDNKTSQALVRPEDLIGQPSMVKEVSKGLSTDGFFICELRKDPKQTKIHVYLFSARSGQLISEESTELKQDNTALVVDNAITLMGQIISKIPYDALIISRTDNRVTINAGSKDGASVGQTLTVVKVIGAKKHPKRDFIIKTNKAILGQVRIVKVDEYLSFADISSETEPGVITNNAKVTGLSQVRYQSTPWTKQYTPPEQLLSENNKAVFGKNAQEWIAKDPPTFGKIGANFSIGSFNNTVGLTDGTNINTQVSAYPRIQVDGEIWITPKVYANGSFAQGIGQSDNPSGSPSEISNSLTQYRLSFGYNFILKNEFFGPKLTVDFGISNYSMYVDTTSDSGFTSVQYRSLPIGIGGYVPITARGNWAIGGKAYFHLFPSFKEKPFSSGAGADSTINQFLFYAENKISQRMTWNIGLELLMFSTNFSGQGGRTTPASNLSHRLTLLNTGVSYMF